MPLKTVKNFFLGRSGICMQINTKLKKNFKQSTCLNRSRSLILDFLLPFKEYNFQVGDSFQI